MRSILTPKRIRWSLAAALLGSALLLLATVLDMQTLPANLSSLQHPVNKLRFEDRNGRALNLTYDNHWNIHDVVALQDIPEFLQAAIVAAEDKRFYRHHGVDWVARFSALKQDLLAADGVRGASTISEQVVKMLHPRPRTVWTRWLEGFEAQALERRVSKQEILEFYLNQAPYAARRRGIKQAAAYYFDRDLSTLNKKEMLALAVMVRSPKWYNPYHYPARLNKAVRILAQRMYRDGQLNRHELLSILDYHLQTRRPRLAVNAAHFLGYLQSRPQILAHSRDGVIRTTLDRDLQAKAQKVLDAKLSSMHGANVRNGALLVVDHHSNEILAWVVAHAGQPGKSFNQIDPVLVPRQPGSALKPFLYARAFAKGWTAATMLEDTPLQEGVGAGLHSYHNYSHDHYGLISVRESLGNSLNIPAVRTIQFIGPADFLQFLRKVGVEDLHAHPNVYGDGLALGDGEVSLLNLTQAYTTLARMGNYKPLSSLAGDARATPTFSVIDPDITSVLANILSDPHAREREFGSNSILDLPQQTAVKTGTSSDYHDAWAMGYNDRYTIGVWFGNLDYSPMHEVTGSSGPAIVLRTLFNELNRGRTQHALYLSPQLQKRRVCIASGLPATNDCESRDEWFVPGSAPGVVVANRPAPRLRTPTNGLMLAYDPRIPAAYQRFLFEVSDAASVRKVDWYVNGTRIASSNGPSYQWPVRRGSYTAYARIYPRGQARVVTTRSVTYTVK